MRDSVGFFVASLEPFERSLDAAGEPYLLEREGARRSLYLQMPGGIIVQLLEQAEAVDWATDEQLQELREQTEDIFKGKYWTRIISINDQLLD